MYQVLHPQVGIPKLICYGTHEDYDFIVLELLGPSLEKLFNYCKRKFSLKTVLMLGDKMIRRVSTAIVSHCIQNCCCFFCGMRFNRNDFILQVEWMHQMCHLHRDLKPDNFVIDSENGSEIYLLDFGLARPYCTETNGLVEHVKRVKTQSFTGTARYASISAQQHYTTSRKDDLESLGYILIYFLKSKLPWQQVPKVSPNGLTPKQRKERILEIKMSTKASDLCAGLPFEFQLFINYCRRLDYEEAPSYAYLRRLLG